MISTRSLLMLAALLAGSIAAPVQETPALPNLATRSTTSKHDLIRAHLGKSAGPPPDFNSTVLEAHQNAPIKRQSSDDPPICLWDDWLYAYQYGVYLPADGSATESGWDAADNCGGGFLDNLHGQGLIVSGWTCNYYDDNSALASFWTIIETGGQVTAAYNAYTGNTVTWGGCEDFSDFDKPDESEVAAGESEAEEGEEVEDVF